MQRSQLPVVALALSIVASLAFVPVGSAGALAAASGLDAATFGGDSGLSPSQDGQARERAGNVTGHPGIDVSVPENEVTPGESLALDLVVLNDGNVTNGSTSNPQLEGTVTTARAVRVRVGDHDAPLDVSTNERAIARLPDGSSVPVQFAMTVDRDAEPGRYTLPVNVTYNYTRSVDPATGATNRTQTSKTFDVTVVVREAASFQVTDVDSSARVGATGTVDVTFRNTGTAVARNASVTLSSRNGDVTFGGTASSSRFVDGTWAPGETRTVSYRVRAAPTASQQRYAFDAAVVYEDDEGATRESSTLSLGVTPAREQTFAVVSSSTTVAVGGDGNVTLTVRNEGPVDVRDATVTLESLSSDVVFGGPATASQYVGRWDANETRTITVEATAVPDAATRNYTVRASVGYEDGEGDPGESGALQFGVRPGPERVTFAAGEVSSDLRVGEEGTLTGTITNTGEGTATNVVVVFETRNRNVSPLETEYAVGSLAPGESATYAFDVEVSEAARAGPRQFTLRPTFRDTGDDRREGESFDVRERVRPDRAVFDVTVDNATVKRGESTRFEVVVTNAGNETLRDVSAQLFADDPVSVDDSDAFASRIRPGESRTLAFEVSAGGDAMPKQYPVEIDFQYVDGDGDTLLTDGQKLPVEVTEPADDGGGPGLVPVLLGALLAVALAAAYLRFGR